MENRHKINLMIELLAKAPSEKVRFELIELFFTSTELLQLQARYDIIQGLTRKSLTQRELAAKLKLSIAKITRGSNELKRRSLELKAYLSEYFTKEEQ